jgi:fumarate reductase subunit D
MDRKIDPDAVNCILQTQQSIASYCFSLMIQQILSPVVNLSSAPNVSRLPDYHKSVIRQWYIAKLVVLPAQLVMKRVNHAVK